MEVESFEDEGVVKLLNDWFISIKVDREEQPDVDKVYMTYVPALYGGGGWPLSVFLSRDLKPLMGGTYFPLDDKYGRPGFKTVLRKVKEAGDSKRDILVKSGAYAIEQLSEALSTSVSLRKLPDDVPKNALRLCAEQIAPRKSASSYRIKLTWSSSQLSLFSCTLWTSRLCFPVEFV